MPLRIWPWSSALASDRHAPAEARTARSVPSHAKRSAGREALPYDTLRVMRVVSGAEAGIQRRSTDLPCGSERRASEATYAGECTSLYEVWWMNTTKVSHDVG
jgi:hypothetical protein